MREVLKKIVIFLPPIFSMIASVFLILSWMGIGSGFFTYIALLFIGLAALSFGLIRKFVMPSDDQSTLLNSNKMNYILIIVGALLIVFSIVMLVLFFNL